jgi:hypothetical protein
MCAAEMQPGGHRDRRPSDPEQETAMARQTAQVAGGSKGRVDVQYYRLGRKGFA